LQIRLLGFRDVKSITGLYMSISDEDKILFHPFPFRYLPVFLIILYFAFSNYLYRITGLITRYTVLSLVADNGGPAGFVFVSNIRNLNNQRMAGNFGIFVKKEFRGSGIGNKLAHEMIDLCNQNMIREIHLTVMAHNKRAISFYKKLGFKVIEYHEKREKWNDEYYPDYTMVREEFI
jgi:RimJ/RimL family protein N-acetyltransferase